MPLSTIKRIIVPQEGIFFEILEKQAETMHEAAGELSKLLHDYRDVEARVKKIKQLEHQGDELMHDLHSELNRNFIVPLDHSDISSLASALDDVADLANSAAKCLQLYEVKAPSEAMVYLSDILVRQTAEMNRAVHALRDHKTLKKAAEVCVEIHRLENEADEAHTRAVAALFKQTDAIELLKQKEILDSLELATDKVEDAANVISDIVMKHS